MLVLMIVHLIEIEIQNQIWKFKKNEKWKWTKEKKENNFSPTGPATSLLA
jgi:hypothetical protein